MSKSKKETFMDDQDDGLSSDSDDQMESSFRVNQKYAKSFEAKASKAHADKERARMETLAQIRAQDSDSESESEDDDGELLTRDMDVQIHKTLAAIRARDKSIYDKKTVFFNEKGQAVQEKRKRKAEKPLTVRDLQAQAIARGEADSGSDSDDGEPKLTYVQEQAKLKKEFLRDVDEDEDEDDDDGLILKKQSAPLADSSSDKKEDEELSKYVSAHTGKSRDDEFLRKYLVNQWWKEKDTSKLPSYKEITGEDEPEQPDVSEDEDLLDNIDEFEAKHNFRFEEQGGAQIQTFPRQIVDTVRKKDDTRKKERERRKALKEEKKRQKIEEIKQLKNAKKKEILLKLEEIKEITGDTSVEFSELDLSKDFDPEEYDKKMQKLFNDDFYEASDDDAGDADAGEDGEDDDNDDRPAGLLEPEQNGKKVLMPKKFLAETQKKLKAAGAAKSEAAKKLEELYKLDFEDVIGGDTPVRFKYMPVPKADYGMTVEDILNLPDKDLNQRISMKKLHPFHHERDDNRPWWKRRGAQQTALQKAGKRSRGSGPSSGPSGAGRGPQQKKRKTTTPTKTSTPQPSDKKKSAAATVSSPTTAAPGAGAAPSSTSTGAAAGKRRKRGKRGGANKKKSDGME